MFSNFLYSIKRITKNKKGGYNLKPFESVKNCHGWRIKQGRKD